MNRDITLRLIGEHNNIMLFFHTTGARQSFTKRNYLFRTITHKQLNVNLLYLYETVFIKKQLRFGDLNQYPILLGRYKQELPQRNNICPYEVVPRKNTQIPFPSFYEPLTY